MPSSSNKCDYNHDTKIQQVISFAPNQESISIKLKQGGKVSLFKDLLTQDEMKNIQDLVQNKNLVVLRKYKVGGVPEPRLHMMFSSSATNHNNAGAGPGYQYHGVAMRAKPLSSVPVLETIAKRLATKFGIDDWRIGVEIILYRDGKDKIGKHADDTQGESLIVSVVAQTDISRVIKIVPKGNYHCSAAGRGQGGAHDEEQDETITLTVNEGDGYVMDGLMQENYVHWVPEVESCTTPRIALIFRQGEVKEVSRDNGTEEFDLNPSVSRDVYFGPPVEASGIQIGSIVEKDVLYHYNAHS